MATTLRDAFVARHEPEAWRVLAHAYWSVLIVLLTLIIIGSVALGVYEFIQPLAPEDPFVSSAKKGLNRAELQKLLEAFDARAAKYDERRKAPLPVKDPS